MVSKQKTAFDNLEAAVKYRKDAAGARDGDATPDFETRHDVSISQQLGEAMNAIDRQPGVHTKLSALTRENMIFSIASWKRRNTINVLVQRLH